HDIIVWARSKSITPIVSLSDVTKDYEQGLLLRRFGLRAVDNVSFSIERGETLGIVGESGSGKSTLLRLMLRLLRPSAGTLEINGKDIWSLRSSELKAFRRVIQ